MYSVIFDFMLSRPSEPPPRPPERWSHSAAAPAKPEMSGETGYGP